MIDEVVQKYLLMFILSDAKADLSVAAATSAVDTTANIARHSLGEDAGLVVKEGLGAGLKIHNKMKSASSINAKKLLQRASNAAVKSGIHQAVDEYHGTLNRPAKIAAKSKLPES